MKVGLFRQGYGKPTQGLQLRGCNHLTEGLIAFTPFNTGSAHEDTAGPSLSHKTYDISPFPYATQWQPGGGLPSGGVSLPEVSPWGMAERFGISNDFYLLYPASDLYVQQFPSGAAPRTLSALIRRFTASDAITDQGIMNYGQFAFFTTAGAWFSMLYDVGKLRFHDNTNTVDVSFPADEHWHMVSLVFPAGGTLNTDVLFYIDGMNVPHIANSGTTTINTVTENSRNDRTYAIGQINNAYAGGTSFNHTFHGLIAGAWVWNRALSNFQQNSHWQDPFQMIARPKSYLTIVLVLTTSCTLSAAPTTVNAGDPVTLTFTTSSADTGSIDNGVGDITGSLPNGSVVVNPLVTTVYTLTVVNSSGSSICTSSVTVNVAAPTCSLSASSVNIEVGQSVTLSWTTAFNPTTGNINNGVGTVTLPTGSTVVSPVVTTTYVLTVGNSAGSSTCQVQIVVRGCPPELATIVPQFA